MSKKTLEECNKSMSKSSTDIEMLQKETLKDCKHNKGYYNEHGTSRCKLCKKQFFFIISDQQKKIDELEKRVDDDTERIRLRDINRGGLYDKINELKLAQAIHIDYVNELHEKIREWKEFIEDCSVSHVESRYKYRAQVLLNKLRRC